MNPTYEPAEAPAASVRLMTASADDQRSSSHATVVKWTAFIVAFLLVTLLVLQSSLAAFSATTANTGNSITAGSVSLTDNDGATAMFAAVSGLSPGIDTDRCITVNYTGTLDPVAVQLYLSTAAGGTGLATYTNLTIDMGNATADAFGSCTSFVSTGNIYTGTLSGIATTNNAFASGLTTWDPVAAASSRTFRFRIAIQDINAAQGLTATGFGFTWETRSA